MGDSVMAVFPTGIESVQAALQMLEKISESDLCRTVGVHGGPALLVRANDSIDYFGQNINVAARLHQIGKPGEIVLSEEVMQVPDVVTLLHRHGNAFRETVATLKGVDHPRKIYHVTVETILKEAA
jgi:class 3 adenylate cyclase